MKRLFLGVVIFIAAATVFYRMYSADQRGFEEYSNRWFTAQHLTPPPFSCSMMDGSGSRLRAGRCYFTWQLSQIGELKQKLNLISTTADPRGACGSFVAGGAAYSSSTPPGPIFPENSQSSFKALYLNETTGQGCLELFYPYG